MKLKNYIVKLKAYSSVVVLKAESEEKAYEYAEGVINRGSFDIDEMLAEEIKDEKLLESAMNHCNEIADPDE